MEKRHTVETEWSYSPQEESVVDERDLLQSDRTALSHKASELCLAGARAILLS